MLTILSFICQHLLLKVQQENRQEIMDINLDNEQTVVQKTANERKAAIQKIIFNPDDKQQQYFETNGEDCMVYGGIGKHDNGSSKIKMKNLVDYKWEAKYYPGRLIAIHFDGHHIAYAIKVHNKPNGTEGMVRILNKQNEKRALIKGMKSEVLDLQFVHSRHKIIIGCIEATSLHVYKIDTIGQTLTATLLIQIDDPIFGHISEFDQLNWCPYVPISDTYEEDDEACLQVVWVRGKRFQCYSINSLIEQHGNVKITGDNVKDGSVIHTETSTITDAKYSPDGSALAISCTSGTIRFYQVYFHSSDKSPRCLHNWKPHGGKSVSNFFFLDNHTKFVPDTSLWKNCITTSNNNTEVKVWCCATWECLQTIRFKTSITGQNLVFKANIDRSSAYLVLSDINNKGIYVLQIVKNGTTDVEPHKHLNGSTTITNGKESDDQLSYAFVKSIAEFPLSSPILSFSIIDASVRRYKCAFSNSDLVDELEDYDDDNNSLYCVVIHMVAVQPKSVQECHVLYQPTVQLSADVSSSLSDLTRQSKSPADDTATITTLLLQQSQSKRNSVEPLIQILPPKQINLMTPESFNASQSTKTPEGVSDEVLSTLKMLAMSTGSSNTGQDVKINSPNNTTNPFAVAKLKSKMIEEKTLRKSMDASIEHQILPLPPAPNEQLVPLSQTSGGSSPSREVQEILSLKDSDCLNEFFDDQSDQLQIDDMDDDQTEMLVMDPAHVTIPQLMAALQNVDPILTIGPESNDLSNCLLKTDDAKRSQARKSIDKTDWPNVPNVPMMTALHSVGQHTSNTSDNELGYKMDQLMETIQAQMCQISELRTEVMEFRKVRNDDQDKLIKLAENIECSLSAVIKESLTEYNREQMITLETMLDTRNSELRDHLQKNILNICTEMTERLSKIVGNEFQRNVLPVMNSKLTLIIEGNQKQIAHSLALNQKQIKENIYQFCTSKEVMTIFGKSLSQGIESAVKEYHEKSMTQIIIPSYEKATQALFRQIYNVFIDGVSGFIRQFDSYLSMYQPLHDDIIGQLTSIPDKIRSVNDSLLNQCSAHLSKDLTKELKTVQINLIKSVQENIRTELQKGFADHSISLEESVLQAVRSQAQTPAPVLHDIREEIKQLLAQNKINKAFHQALLANDLSLVQHTLEMANFDDFFEPCPLEQTVLLSLIQQISADMNSYNELRHRYLNMAVVSLNMQDAVTREHAPNLLRELFTNCQVYLRTNPSNKINSSLRMLLMAIHGLNVF